MELSYLEVGLGSQSIHMEFGDGGVAYTLLVRDSLRCRRFFGVLTGKRKSAKYEQSGKLFLLMYGKAHKRKVFFSECSQRNKLSDPTLSVLTGYTGF